MSQALSQLSPDELIARCEMLSHKLEGVTLERDDLQRDVELLCMQSSSATFNSSSILQERLFVAESELARLRTQHQKLQEERDGLREDHVHFKQAKRLSDNSYRETLARCQKLETTLAFYQEQSALAMQDRDRATSDAEYLKDENIQLQTTLKATQAQLEHEKQLVANLQRVQTENKSTIKQLEHEAADARLVPGLQDTVKNRDDAIAKLKEEIQGLKIRLTDKAASLEGALRRLTHMETHCSELEEAKKELQATLDAATSQHTRQVASLEATVREKDEQLEASASRIASLEQQVADGAETITQLRSELEKVDQTVREEMRAAVRTAQQQATFQQAECSRLEATLHDTEEQLAAGLARAERAEAAAASASDAERQAKALVDDLTAKIKEVTQEKVEMLMEIAELKEQMRDGTTVDREDADAWNAWPWQPNFTPPKKHTSPSPASNPPLSK